ncbi:cobalamin B12-binding domain-containing protein [Aestuariivirga sp.]|uniref:cobalamin B12-binding domain-containing protein n=1 Tax=Aestuariivirga sp. TaxID=2650926 RepID=UPI003BA909A2
MTNEQDEFGMASVKPDFGPAGSAGPGGGFLPPLDVAVDLPDFRYAKLKGVVAELVVPHLLALHETVQEPAATEAPPRTEDIAQLAQLVLGPDNDDAANYMLKLKDGGVSLDDLHAELLEPAARRLGELWNEDAIDFVDVTLGVGRLQRLVHLFGRLDRVPDYDEKRRVLLAAAPGEQHSLGTTIVQKFLRAAGWHVWTCSAPSVDETADITSQEWFAVVGFSVGSDVHLDQLATAIARVRQRSRNPRVGVMVGGSAISRDPGIVKRVGADGTAANGPAAVILAKKLLAESLT